MWADAFAKADCENVEKTVKKGRMLFAGFVARIDNERLPKRVMFGKWRGGKLSLIHI